MDELDDDGVPCPEGTQQLNGGPLDGLRVSRHAETLVQVMKSKRIAQYQLDHSNRLVFVGYSEKHGDARAW